MNKSTECLLNKKCQPCQGGVPPLPSEDIERFLKEVGGEWSLNTRGHLYKEYRFNDFMGPMNLANKIAALAEREGHHPDLAISWGRCVVEIWTHKINGLTESDFILAAKIDSLA
ncbi:MAG: 4a-hydroxytetrahydrobiopterin dehydratase [Alphaproteobacteria bacterium 41-28]|nr:MAG: 4a-hydroxytetrahydrobiopterin dehydratase [Alphaproteobacteria bacterium 41-28]